MTKQTYDWRGVAMVTKDNFNLDRATFHQENAAAAYRLIEKYRNEGAWLRVVHWQREQRIESHLARIFLYD